MCRDIKTDKAAIPWSDSHSVLAADRLVSVSAVFSADALRNVILFLKR